MSVFQGAERIAAEKLVDGNATADLGGMTNEQLRALCAERGVEVPKRATKAQLLKLLGA